MNLFTNSCFKLKIFFSIDINIILCNYLFKKSEEIFFKNCNTALEKKNNFFLFSGIIFKIMIS